MKVLFIGEYALGQNAVSGVQAVSRVMCNALSKQPDIDLHVIAFQPGIDEGIEGKEGYTLYRIPANPNGGLVTQGRDDRRKLVRKFAEISPDIIHANQSGVHALAALDSGLPTVLTVHGIFPWLSRALYGGGVKGRVRQALFNRLHRGCLRRAKHVILISPYVEEAIKPYTNAATYRIDVPIDPVYFERTWTHSDNELLFVGLISERKGVDNLLRAFGMVLQNHPDLRLNIVGKVADEQYNACLLAYLEENKLADKVRWLGVLDRSSLADRYASSAMLILPSLEETTPGVIAEAMAVGCPVVASRVGGVPTMIQDGATGLLVEPRDSEGLAGAISKLLEDRTLRQEISGQARDVAVERFAPWSVAAKTVEVYGMVIEVEKANQN